MQKAKNELAIARRARDLRQRNTALESVVAELRRESDRLRVALEHYADASSWPQYGEEGGDRDVYGLECDGWTVAAEALGYRLLEDGTEVSVGK